MWPYTLYGMKDLLKYRISTVLPCLFVRSSVTGNFLRTNKDFEQRKPVYDVEVIDGIKIGD